MQRATKGVVIGGAVAVVVAAAGFGGYDLYRSVSSKPAADAVPAPKVTPPPSAAEVRTAAHDFLTAWASGDVAKAAALTDNGSQATAELTSYRSDLHVSRLTLTDKPATGARVPFSVRAGVSYDGQDSTWDYDSALTVVRDPSGKPVVKWTPAVLHPKLAAGQTLEAAPSSTPPPVTAVDRNGQVLTAAKYPSLAGILTELQAKYGNTLQGTPGMDIRVKGADGKAGDSLHPLSQGKPGKPLRTTIDANLQAQAEKAVTTQGPDAAVVAIQPSTGGVLAVADNPAGGYNKAMMGTYAPGSTFKVITASTLLTTGKVTPGTPLDCPKTISYGGRSFHNVEGMQIDRATLAQDFAASCNTAFISTANVLPDGAVENEAHDVFGLGLSWSTGVPSWDGKVPVGSGSEKAMTMIGQGQVQVNPLDMASVAATARSGVFHQPVIVPVSVDNRQIAQAPQQLPSSVDADLRSMMVLTARQGTAAPTVGTLSGDVGAKTGTAEVDGQTKPNSWFLAYRDDVAAAAVVPNTGEGYKFAGKIVAALLSAN
ncbi:penicillin-binding transpeptidase domain-containing protein [Streptantibioticus ferralitis]|uniref:Penicillin-binding transpeptidase domain-containing protein n=1 Tax=Streptantibioticus ferralitis TaxID=236510 RepID=A0ABT5Z8Z2_9ACTN|nr:penicillin-binding transpeptidase domain-containing protein [Streptantibioticus ferralitis]MDF2260288.1 penicillin-binding transpeptidase domain-containing protein [Streptantibioticus ferralitis]